MKFENVYLHSFGKVLPPNFLTSEQIENQFSSLYERLKLSVGRLELQTGIKSRGYWPLKTLPSDISTKAGELALKNFDRSKLDLLIHASVCRDYLEPATAARVHSGLKLNANTSFFDLSNACLGVLSSIMIAGQMIESRAINSALIVSGENSAPLLLNTIEKLKTDLSLTRKDLKNYMASLTIGSAGVAVLLTNKELAPHGHQILGGVSLSDSSAAELCHGGGSLEELMMETQSEELMIKGVKLAKENWNQFKQELSVFNNSPFKIIPHQVGHIHRKNLLETLNLNLDQDYSTFEKYGNTGSAALILTLIEAVDNGFINKKDMVSLLGIGSGLTSVMLGVKW